MTTISVVINARTTSSRLPRKLVLPFAGSTLVDIALEKINRMDFFDHRYFATAEGELKQRAPKYPNVELLERSPDSILPGYNPNHRVIWGHYERIQSEYILWFNPCCPLLGIDTIRKAYDMVKETRYNAYTSVVPTRDWIFDEGGMPVTNKSSSSLSTGHSERYFRVAHNFHIFRKDYFLENNKVWSLAKNDPCLIEIPEDESFDINDPIDFDVAEIAYKKFQKSQHLK